MRFTDFSFGSIRVDDVTYGHDLIIDAERSASAARPHPRGSAARMATLRCRSPRTFPGDVGGWSSVPVRTARCR
jgi:hypothetical protein